MRTHVFACLAVLMVWQTIYGMRQRYEGQAVVYFIATYVMFEMISPLNIRSPHTIKQGACSSTFFTGITN